MKIFQFYKALDQWDWECSTLHVDTGAQSECYCKAISGRSQTEGELTSVYFISSQWTFCQVKWKNYRDKNHQLSQTTETKPGHFLFVNIFYFNIPSVEYWCHTGDQGDNLIRLDIPARRTIRPLYLSTLRSEYRVDYRTLHSQPLFAARIWRKLHPSSRRRKVKNKTNATLICLSGSWV